MKSILKVTRCNRHKFRFGIHLTEQEFNFQNIRKITLFTIDNTQIDIADVSSFRRYQSIIDIQIGEWINIEGWTHGKRKPMKLVKFDLQINENTLELHYVGPSDYRKVPNNRKYLLEGQPIETAARFEDEINTIWNRNRNTND